MYLGRTIRKVMLVGVGKKFMQRKVSDKKFMQGKTEKDGPNFDITPEL